ncbi:MAG TPA: GAF domain-containing protein [Candidatus Acidoferrales bacterium]|nr:GAF domain-containing protein [Candidatus Acidoferrales bacterium]
MKIIAKQVGQGNRSAEGMKQIAEWIRSSGGYRWVGVYEVIKSEIGVIAFTGTEAPAHPRFPVTQGLCGAAVASKSTVNVGDVRKDPRWLTTFDSTRSEIIVPVLSAGGRVAGLIDVESDRLDAFGREDTQFLESCAFALPPLFAATPSKE